MKNKNTAYFILIYGLFFTYAVGTSILGTFMVDFLNDFGMDVSGGGIFTVLYNTGCLAGVIVSAFVLKYFQNRTWIFITYAVFALGMLAVSWADTLTFFLILLLLIGIATKFLDLTVNTEIAAYHDEQKGFYINLLHGCFGAGSFAGPLLAAKLLTVLPRWQMIYGYIGAVSVALLVLFLFKGKAPVRTAAIWAQNQNCMNFGILKKPVIIYLLLAMFFYCGHQGGISTWVPLYLQYQYDAGTFTASMGSSLFWVCLVIGRLVCARLTIRFMEEHILTVGLALAIVLHLAGVLIPVMAFAMIGYAAAGLFAGAAIPLILTIGYKECADCQSTVSVVFFVSISMGHTVFPWVMGLICGTFGLTWGMASNVLCLVGTLVFIILFLKTKRTAVPVKEIR
ncbi:MFS transporter [Muricomes sp. OA1]|uniref:MFS transporter n=1 Tax=Hungatella hathewayi TaxID=154046 RepID=A0A3E2WXZ6_9FIRM|nr:MULTISPECIES: MFS transporter [Clostridia]MCH1974606.1 MFS transporter [Muricomes sp. OA1]RGC33041.1 MFS transporter [Hungatella hathewayi]GKH33387.1 MFS transporter [Faecalicatena contorta]